MAIATETVDTKTKIMDVAERFFAEKGIDATSMRMIISEAGVNLAAIHYHFGSKDELLRAVMRRFIDIVNQERLKRLDLLEAGKGKPSLELLIESFLGPVVEAAEGEPHRAKYVMRLAGQLQSDPGRFQKVIGDLFVDVARRFITALGKILPQLSKAELAWRFKFMLGTMHMMVAQPPMPNALKEFVGPDEDMTTIVKYLVGFVAAGFRAQPQLSRLT